MAGQEGDRLVPAFLAKPAIKYGALALAILALIVGTLWVVSSIYGKGEKSGKAEVTTKVQTETIKKTDEARKDKEKANETVRDKPIDAVIDGLR
jgi:hypothetical protein